MPPYSIVSGSKRRLDGQPGSKHFGNGVCLLDTREQPATRRRGICQELNAQLREAISRALEEDVGRVLVSPLTESTGQENSAREVMLG